MSARVKESQVFDDAPQMVRTQCGANGTWPQRKSQLMNLRWQLERIRQCLSDQFPELWITQQQRSGASCQPIPQCVFLQW